MKKQRVIVGVTVALFCIPLCLANGAEPASAGDKAAAARSRPAYGEWRIHVRPDKGKEYAELIETKGLPLFRQAGGRMVGWWTTLVGDLYEHVTIWQYDDMAAFEQAGAKLGQNKQFAEFVLKRDPLLLGEGNRFLHLADFGVEPVLPEPAKVVVHEVHRVAFNRRNAYMEFMKNTGLSVLKRRGFRVVGPWVVGVGDWTEVTYLFCFESLRQRQELIAAFSESDDGQLFNREISGLTESVATRVLLPAPFAK